MTDTTYSTSARQATPLYRSPVARISICSGQDAFPRSRFKTMRAHSLGHPFGGLHKPAWLLLLLVCPFVRLEAQTALYVRDGDEVRLVQAFLRGQPMVEKNGKLVEPSDTRCALKKVDEYLPIHIAVRNWEVHTFQLEVMGTGDALNKTISMGGELESPIDLERVFVVLELTSEEQGKVLFGWEVGQLKARESRSYGLRIPLSVGLGQGNYQLHLYVNGREVFSSMMPMGAMENAIHRMVWKRIAGVNDAEPRPFVCPVPEIPKSFKKSKEKGIVTVSFRIMANGSVLDPKVVSTTHPELVEPTLDAVRLWYFLPRVKNGQPVEARVQMPINFAAPTK